ncbi:MAG: hypothetical protein PWP23_1994 [Candidatus Sumerlaeota bacterium]|nr:hypothetical protein [Candidatus Sumerlaeota bacterium]
MKEVLDKLSSYNIFNHLLPGVVFVILAEALTTFHFVQQDIILGIFLYYFIGMVISRLGSLVVEPSLKITGLLEVVPYSDFVTVSREDEKLVVLSESSNTYRTLCALFMALVLLEGYERLSLSLPKIQPWTVEILIIALFAIFCMAYRKQCQYITKRVNSHIKTRGADHG